MSESTSRSAEGFDDDRTSKGGRLIDQLGARSIVAPILLGGLIAPIVWSGLVHGVVDFIAPPLNQRIDWAWFVLSQVGFGIVAGIIVSRQERIHTLQYFPFALRAGFEAPGAVDEKDGGKAR